MSEIILIAALAANNVIGKGNSIPWHIRADFQHFKELTLGSPVIMGARTWESLPKRPLPGRRNIVLSRRKGLELEGGEVVGTLSDALKLCNGADKAFIIGGASVYQESMVFATRMELTCLERAFEGDTHFPWIDPEEWVLERSEKQPEDPRFGAYTFETWARKVR